MTIGAKTPIVIVNSSLLRSFDEKEVETVLAHETAHVLSEHYTYTTALVLLSQFLLGALPRSLLLGLPVRAMYLALLEWSRAAELSADRAAALVMGDPLQPCRVLMALAGGSAPGMNFEAFLKQASEYDAEDDLFSRHARFWSELNLTHPVAVRRVKELTEWVDTGAYDRIRDGDYPRRGEEPPPSQEFEDAVAHYRERFARILDRAAGGVQDLGRRLGSWLDRFQNSGAGPNGPRRVARARRRGRGPFLRRPRRHRPAPTRHRPGTGAVHLLPATSARRRHSSIEPKVTTRREEPQFSPGASVLSAAGRCAPGGSRAPRRGTKRHGGSGHRHGRPGRLPGPFRAQLRRRAVLHPGGRDHRGQPGRLRHARHERRGHLRPGAGPAGRPGGSALDHRRGRAGANGIGRRRGPPAPW